MKSLKLIQAGLIVGVALAALILALPQAKAAFPSYTASLDVGSSAIRLDVSNADPFSQIDFYGRQGSQLWTVMTNIGHADQFGRFFGTVNPGFFLNSTPIETYLLVNGQSTGIVTLNSQFSNPPFINPPFVNPPFNNNPPFINPPFNDPFSNCITQPFLCNNSSLSASRTNVNMSRNSSTTVTFFPRFQQALHIAALPNINVATVSLSGATLRINSLRSGSTSVRVCTFNQVECATVFINVSGTSGNDSQRVTFSRDNVSLDQGESQTVGLGLSDTFFSPNTFGNSFFYIASNSNSSDVSAHISDNTLHVFGRDDGTARIEVCAQVSNVRCSTLRVTVDDDFDDDDDDNDDIEFFPDRLSLAVGESRTASGFRNGFESTLFLDRNSNSSVATATVSGNDVTVFGQNSGNTTLTLCVINQPRVCGSLRVSVSGVLGSSTFSNGALVAVNSTIYQIYRNQKSGFANLQAFRDFGFRLENVLFVNNLNNIPTSSHIINTAQASHPWGTWIRMNNTIHFVHESGLIPVPNFDVFLSNGGNSNLVVPANSFDFNLPILPIMTFNDFRLR